MNTDFDELMKELELNIDPVELAQIKKEAKEWVDKVLNGDINLDIKELMIIDGKFAEVGCE